MALFSLCFQKYFYSGHFPIKTGTAERNRIKDKEEERIPYGVNGTGSLEGNRNQDYKNGVTLHFDSEKSNNLEDILSCVHKAVILGDGSVRIEWNFEDFCRLCEI